MRAVEMDSLLSLSDFPGGGYYWMSERPNRRTTAARLHGTPLRTGVRKRRRRREESLTKIRPSIFVWFAIQKFESRLLQLVPRSSPRRSENLLNQIPFGVL
jgi:hypothetical protein